MMGVEGSSQLGRDSNQKAGTVMKQRLGVLDQTAVTGMEIEKELGVSFEAPTILVAATPGHQPAIPIIHRNQSHSWRVR